MISINNVSLTDFKDYVVWRKFIPYFGISVQFNIVQESNRQILSGNVIMILIIQKKTKRP